MINPNLNKVINVALAMVILALFLVIANVALSSIDKVTTRDCARGITSACQYVK